VHEQPDGQFLFTDGRAGGTGVAVAKRRPGLFDTYSEIGHRAYTIFRANMWEGFAQDSWKTRQNLTLTFGSVIPSSFPTMPYGET